jgi:hypothetical protein
MCNGCQILIGELIHTITYKGGFHMKIDHFDDLEENAIIKHVKTEEDFFPTPANGRIEISLTIIAQKLYGPDLKSFRICVWGEGEYGMEYETDDLKVAVDLFNGIIDGVTKEHLKSRLFLQSV